MGFFGSHMFFPADPKGYRKHPTGESWPFAVEKKTLEYLGVDKLRPKNKCPTPTGSMGLVYLPTWKPWKSTIHLGKYTSPMDPMGQISELNFIFQDVSEKPLDVRFFGEAMDRSTWIYSSKMTSVKLSSLMVSHKNYVLRVVKMFKQWEASWKIIGTSWFQSTNSRNSYKSIWWLSHASKKKCTSQWVHHPQKSAKGKKW